MSNDFEDPPLEFPDLDTEEVGGDSISHAEPLTGYKWTLEFLQLLELHGIDPDRLENDGEEEEEEEEEEEKPGNFLTHLSCQC